MKSIKLILLLTSIFLSCAGCSQKQDDGFTGNPILAGSFADPSIVKYDDTFYIYSTTGNDATVWYSKDFVNWKLRTLNWPTSTKIGWQWAPSMRKIGEYYYLFYSLKSQIYVGRSKSPLGSFENVKSNEAPFIKDKEYFPPKIHTIDADAFVDDDGRAYLYWGSGWNFKNGVCAVAELKDDVSGFKHAPKNITPTGYFEGPYMLKNRGKYYLMYSDGVYTNGTYCVKYSVSDSPTGPFKYGKNNPILQGDGKIAKGPGHHSAIKIGDKHYIVYHKIESDLKNDVLRQVCIDELKFDADGNILKVVPTNNGVFFDFVKQARKNMPKTLSPIKVKASSEKSQKYSAQKAFDKNFGTRWEPTNADENWLVADFGKVVNISAIKPIFSKIRAKVKFKIEYSTENIDNFDGVNKWQEYGIFDNSKTDEWPLELKKEIHARHLKITIFKNNEFLQGLWEFIIFEK